MNKEKTAVVFHSPDVDLSFAPPAAVANFSTFLSFVATEVFPF